MTKSNLKVLLYCLVTILYSCQRNDKLIGQWERYGDDLAGLKVEAVKEGESFKAKIIAIPDSCAFTGFIVGDIKWMNIKKTIDNKYEFEDLGKVKHPLSSAFTHEYTLTNLELVSDSEIHTRVFSKETESIGTEQKWKRTMKE